MKKLILTLAIGTLASGLFAQTTFFATKVGAELTYMNKKSAKGKATGYSKMTIKDVQGSGGNMTISYENESLDKKGKPFDPRQVVPLTVIIQDNTITLDMKGMFVDAMKDQAVPVNVTGTSMEIPNDLRPGQALNDAEMTMMMDLGIMKMITVVKMTEGKCEAVENVTVAAGTFSCHKVSQTVTTTVMKKTTVMKVITWYAPNIGTVKTETWDSKNKLKDIMELAELKGN